MRTLGGTDRKSHNGGSSMLAPLHTPDSTPMKKVRNTRLTNVLTLQERKAPQSEGNT